MDANTLLFDLVSRGIVVTPNGEKLIAQPASRLTEADCAAIRTHKSELLDLLRISAAGGSHQGITPNSRAPLVRPAIRTLIEGIEAEARAKGWPAELLWNAEFWGSPRGLATVLDDDDAIVEVTPDYIGILKTHSSILRFQRRVS
jgi:hypothetical protein